MTALKTSLVLLVVSGCLSSNIHEATTGSSTGSSAGTSSGSSAGTSAAGASSTGTATGATSTGGATSSGTSGGTTGATIPTCPAGASWIGSTCAVSACQPQYTGAGCLLGDGGFGECLGARCIDVTSDPLHCGSPETACALGMACVAGVCVGASGCAADGGCPTGEVCQADGKHCLPSDCDGAAGQRHCNGGVCCGDTCTTLDGGADCGACGNSCVDGGFCYADPLSGAFKCGDCSSAPAGAACNGGICCGGACVDQTSDGMNCGACGHTCALDGGGSCNTGFCTSSCGGCGCAGCPTGSSCFEGFNVSYCVSTTCTSAEDGFPCGQDAVGVCCGGVCLIDDSLAADPKNCGACGNACPDGDVCNDSVCVQFLGCLHAPSETLCVLDGGRNGVCCDGECVDTTSTENCTECGSACPIGSTCTINGCSVFFCTPESCPSGTICVSGQCFPGCTGRNDGDYCAAEMDGGSSYFGYCCAGVCRELGDPQACGGCGLICPAGTACAGGCQIPFKSERFACGEDGGPLCPSGYGCLPMSPPEGDICAPEDCVAGSDGDICAYGPGTAGTCCGGTCVLLTHDPANCGACGYSCPSGSCTQEYQSRFNGFGFVLVPIGVCKPSAPCVPDCPSGLTCVDGSCVDGLCTGDACITEGDEIGACCGNAACIDLATDSANCGGCGLACPTGDACVAGKCQGDACSVENQGAYCGPKDATHVCCGNACVDTSSDAANCGGCGVSCLPGAACSGGSCG